MAKPTVIIIAGGANSRFFPFQTFGHKGAFPLLGKPLMARTLQSLQEHGYEKVVCVITPKDSELNLTQQIVQESGVSLAVTFVIQPEPRGMGDATLLGLASMSADELHRFAIISAYQTNAGEMLDQMCALGDGMVLASASTKHPTEYGMLSFTEQGLVNNVIEKPAVGTAPSDQKILTMYVMTNAFVEQLKITPPAEYNFETALSAILQRQPAQVLKLSQEPQSLKYPWQALGFLQMLLGKISSFRATTAQIAPTAVIDETHGAVHIGENTKIGHASRIVGPCYIGDDVSIGDFVLVRESSLENGVELGCFTEIARSIIGAETHFHSGYVGDSILGQYIRVGAGFINANKRIDRRSIGVMVKGKVVDSGINRLGVMIGERAQVGIHVSVMPGKCIGPSSVVYPHQSVTENVTEASQSNTSK